MTATQQARGTRVRRVGQVALGAIWLIDGALQFQPVMFGRSFVTDVILPNAFGQPTVLAAPVNWIGHLIEPHAVLFNALAATLQVLIGLGLMSKRTVKSSLAVSFVWAMAIWVVGEGAGGLLTGTASPLTGAPGAALLYIVVGLMVWPRDGDSMRGERLAWAVLWLASAGLWLLPANQAPGSVHDAIASTPSGADWLATTLRAVAHMAAGQGTSIALTAAGLSTLIAVSALAGAAQRSFVALGVVVSMVFWVVGQGFGGVLSGTATDVSTGPLVILMGCILLADIDRISTGAKQAPILSLARRPGIRSLGQLR